MTTTQKTVKSELNLYALMSKNLKRLTRFVNVLVKKYYKK